jgi:hypothetical protein
MLFREVGEEGIRLREFLGGLALTTLRRRSPWRFRTSALGLGDGHRSSGNPWARHCFKASAAVSRGYDSTVWKVGSWGPGDSAHAPRAGAISGCCLPRPDSRSRPLAHPDRSHRCGAHVTPVGPSRGPTRTPALLGGHCPRHISASSPPGRIGTPPPTFWNSPISGLRFGMRAKAGLSVR